MIISKSFKPRTEEGFGDDIFFSTNSNLVFFDEIEGKPSLTKVMAAEVKNRTEADNAEAKTREDADTALGKRIDTEAQTRESADTALGGRITSLEADNTKNIASIGVLQESIININDLIGDVPEDTDTLYNLIVGLQDEDSNINSLIGEVPEVPEGEEVPTLYSSIATLQEENVNIKALIGEIPEEETKSLYTLIGDLMTKVGELEAKIKELHPEEEEPTE